MKILYYEPSTGFGGSSANLARVLKVIDRTKFEPVMVASNIGPQIKKINQVEIVHLPGAAEQKNHSYAGFFMFIVRRLIPEAVRLFQMIHRQDIRLIHINTNIRTGIPAILAANWAGIPCISYIREYRPLTRIERFFVSRVSQFMVLSNEASQLYQTYIPKRKLSVIYDGISLDEYNGVDPSCYRNEIGSPSSPLIGMAGRIVKGKGHKEFIDAAIRILSSRPEARFIIIGSPQADNDPYYQEVIEKVRMTGLDKNIIFTGWRNDIANIISALDIFVFPSTTYAEGLPNAIIEAMALGKPVVAGKISGPSEIVEEGKTGFLVDARDPGQLAERIEYLLDRSAEARKMGDNGKARVQEHFDVHKQARGLEAIYSKTLSI